MGGAGSPRITEVGRINQKSLTNATNILIQDLSFLSPGGKVFFIVKKGFINQIDNLWLEEFSEERGWFRLALSQISDNVSVPEIILYRVCASIEGLTDCKTGEKTIFPQAVVSNSYANYPSFRETFYAKILPKVKETFNLENGKKGIISGTIRHQMVFTMVRI